MKYIISSLGITRPAIKINNTGNNCIKNDRTPFKGHIVYYNNINLIQKCLNQFKEENMKSYLSDCVDVEKEIEFLDLSAGEVCRIN